MRGKMYRKLHTGMSINNENVIYTYYDKCKNFTRISMDNDLFYAWFYEEGYGITCSNLTDAINKSIEKFDRKYGWKSVLKNKSISN